MKKQIEVVAAVIKKDNKYFAAQRKDEGELARKWEFPGGKVEKGETPKEALKREIKEELNVEIKVTEFVTTVVHEYESFIITLHAYYAEYLSGEFKPNEHLETKFLTKEEMKDYDFAAADIPIIQSIK